MRPSHPRVVPRRAVSAQGRFSRAPCLVVARVRGGRSGPVLVGRGSSGRAEWQALGGRSCEVPASFGEVRLVGSCLVGGRVRQVVRMGVGRAYTFAGSPLGEPGRGRAVRPDREPIGPSGSPFRETCKGVCPLATPTHDALTRPPTRHDLAGRTSPTTAEPPHTTPSARTPTGPKRFEDDDTATEPPPGASPARLRSTPTAGTLTLHRRTRVDAIAAQSGLRRLLPRIDSVALQRLAGLYEVMEFPEALDIGQTAPGDTMTLRSSCDRPPDQRQHSARRPHPERRSDCEGARHLTQHCIRVRAPGIDPVTSTRPSDRRAEESIGSAARCATRHGVIRLALRLGSGYAGSRGAISEATASARARSVSLTRPL